MIKVSIVSENMIDEIHVKSEEKTSNVKLYRHPNYQETFQVRQEGQYQHHEERILHNFQYSWNKA